MSVPAPNPHEQYKIVDHGNLFPQYGSFVDSPIEWTVTDDGTGLLSGNLKRVARYPYGSTVSVFALPKQGDKHPFDFRLRCKDWSVSHGPNELATISINYIGLDTDPGGVSWDWNGPTDETPIDMHPDFPGWGTIRGSPPPKDQTAGVEVPDSSKIYSDRFGTVNWDTQHVMVDSQQKFSGFKTVLAMKQLDLPGVRGYKTPRATLRVNFSTARVGMFATYVSQLGRWYDNIPIKDVEREIPSAVSPKSWLLTSLSVSAFAGIYKVQLEFTLSGEKGWNKLIYRKGGPSTGANASLAPPGGWPTSSRGSWGT